VAQGVWCVEQPMDITTNSPSTTQASHGPVTRSRAHGIENEVTSLLIEFSCHLNETWVLPQSGMLCMVWYEGMDLED
jgi:hypothetical protein